MIANYYGEDVDCASQSEVDDAVDGGKVPIISASISLEIKASFRIKITAGTALLTVLGASAPQVETWGSSNAKVVTRESSNAQVETRESSNAKVVTWGSSNAKVVGKGDSQLRVKGKLNVTAGPTVAIVAIGTLPTIDGGGFVRRSVIDTPEKWCEYYGIEVADGCAVLFKGLDENFRSGHGGFLYQPGETQRDPNWNPDPGLECGPYGLFFSPSPGHTFEFAPGAKKFVGCLVPLAQMIVHADGEYPHKVRAPETFGCWEVDVDGKRIDHPSQAAALEGSAP